LTRLGRRYLLRSAVRSLNAASANTAVRFHTDTRRLADDYGRVCGAEFAVLPIPVNPRLRPSNREPSFPLTVTYLGDARAEKGYELLPDLVHDAMSDPDVPKFQARIQSKVVQTDSRS